MQDNNTLILDVQRMSCASCVGRVEKAANAVDGVISAVVNLPAENVQITHTGALNVDTLVGTLTEAGYPTSRIRANAEEKAIERHTEVRKLGYLTLIAACLAFPVFVVEMGSHFSPAIRTLVENTIGEQTSRVIQWFLTTLVLFGPGLQFYVRGMPALLKRAPEMNSLVALGTAAAYLFSTVSTFLPSVLPTGANHVYFESAAVIVVLILAGRYMEARAKGRTGDAIAAMMNLQVQQARVLRNENGVTVPVDQLMKGDIVQVLPGERIAADGIIIDGSSFIDESMITGEPLPVERKVDDPVIGGTLNGAGAFQFKVTKVGRHALLAQIIALVEQAQGAKLPIQSLVDRVTAWFVPLVMAIAMVTFFAWVVMGSEPVVAKALVAAVSVLIIACPCAMGLATPTSIMVASGVAARMGILFRKGDALQLLDNTSMVALDKTGTLTKGHPELTYIQCHDDIDQDSLLQLVASIESHSEHPVAKATVDALYERSLPLLEVANFTSLTGRGVRAQVNEQTVVVGNLRLMTDEGVDVTAMLDDAHQLNTSGATTLYVGIDGQSAGLIGVSDTLKPNSSRVVKALHDRGLEVVMITGDNQQTADALAKSLGIDLVIAEVLPQDKASAIIDMQGRGHRVAFIGDGINDAPALAQAEVGIAIGTGTDVAIEAADVVLMSGDLAGVVNAMQVSRHTLKNIQQNLVWAFGYNILLIPIAAGILFPFLGILLSPMLAAGAMALSSVLVIGNALRLRWLRPLALEGDDVFASV